MKRSILFTTVLNIVWLSISAQWSPNPAANTLASNISGDSHKPILLSDANGIDIIWRVKINTTDVNIYAQRLNNDGIAQWGANGVAVCTIPVIDNVVAAAIDGTGGLIITWEDKRNGNSDIFAQRINGAGTIQWAANGVSVCTTTVDQNNPQIIADGSGGAIITWQDGFFLDASTDTNIYAQRIDSSGIAQWTNNGVVICNAQLQQFLPRIVSDGSDGAIICWTDQRDNANLNVYAQKINSSGILQWSANGVLVNGATHSFQSFVEMAVDGISGAVITWSDDRNGSLNLYVQRISSAGAVQWVVNGITVCDIDGAYGDAIVTDQNHNCFISWEDSRSGASKTYIQKFDSLTGLSQWIANGVSCSDTVSQDYSDLTSDGAGGVTVTFEDGSSTTSDIRVQRLDNSGNKLWTNNGALLCSATNDQVFPKITSNADAGFVVTWQDKRISSNQGRIYAQNICQDGQLGADCSLGTAQFDLESTVIVFPNPSKGIFTIKAQRTVSEIAILDPSGKQVLRVQPNLLDTALDMRGYCAGIYIMQIRIEEKTMIEKIVLE